MSLQYKQWGKTSNRSRSIRPLLKTVTNPLSLLLIVLAIVSLLTASPTAALIITIVVIFGGLLRFSQEF